MLRLASLCPALLAAGRMSGRRCTELDHRKQNTLEPSAPAPAASRPWPCRLTLNWTFGYHTGKPAAFLWQWIGAALFFLFPAITYTLQARVNGGQGWSQLDWHQQGASCGSCEGHAHFSS